MSKLNEKRLNQMIENALSYKQEVKTLNQNSFFRRLKVFIFKPKVYGFTFASFVISYVFIPQILIVYDNVSNSLYILKHFLSGVKKAQEYEQVINELNDIENNLYKLSLIHI